LSKMEKDAERKEKEQVMKKKFMLKKVLDDNS
jgi:hypothetical protein